MPDKKSLLGEALQDTGYNPDLTSTLSKGISPLQEALGSIQESTVMGDDKSPIFQPNQQYNVNDESHINKDMEASDSWWKNTYNDFWQSYYNTQLQTIQGKAEAGANLGTIPWAKYEGPAAILDVYPDRVKDLDADLKEGRIDNDAYNTQRANLDKDKQAAEQQMTEYKAQEADVQNKLNALPQVNKQFKQKQAMVNQQADAASTWDRIYTGLGNTVGSSASLMLPNFLADFGNKAVQNLIKVGAANLLPVGGEVADGIGVAAALIGTVGEHFWSRAQETYAEIAQPIADARAKLTDEYLKKHNLTDASQIPDEDQRQIRIQSRQGVEKQFRENMFLSVTDIAAATLLPFSNVGYGVGKLAKGAQKALGVVDHLAEEANYYGKMAKIASRVGKTYAEMQTEGFEEGLQQAAQSRADEANKAPMTEDEKKKSNTWSNTITNAISDGYDTASSIDLIPGQAWTNLGGKYADNSEFQSSVWGGQFLGSLMSGPLTGLAIGKDIQRFKAANQDLIKSGVLDADSKFLSLRNSILKKYFDNGQVEYLAGALRDLKKAKDDSGNPVMDPAEVDKTARDIKNAYELYQDINDHVDNKVGKDAYFGLFNSNELAVSKEKLKADVFDAATSITMHTDKLSQLDSDIATQQAKDGVFNLNQDEVSDRERALLAQKQAIGESIDAHENKVNDTVYFGPYWSKRLEAHIEDLKDKAKEVDASLKELGDQVKTSQYAKTHPSPALADLYKQKLATELYLTDAKKKYADYSKIRTKSDLKNYVAQNITRPVPPQSPMNAAPVAPAQATAPVVPAPIAPTAAVEMTPVTPAVAPAPVVNTDSEEEDRKSVQKEFRAIIDSAAPDVTIGKNLDHMFSMIYGDSLPEKLGLADVVEDLKHWFKDDLPYLTDNFEKIRKAVEAVNPGQPELILDPVSYELSTEIAAGSVPFIQSGNWSDDLNSKLNDIIRESQWEPGTTKMITHGLSIAQLNTESEFSYYIDKKVHGDSRDEAGELRYSEQSDQQLNNTNAVKVGDKVSIQLDDLGGITDVNNTADSNHDQAIIGVYKEVSEVVGGTEISKTVRIGSIHRVSKLRELLSPTINGVPNDVEAQKDIVRQLRKTIIQTNETIHTTIIGKGFGYFNKRGDKFTISNAIGKDTRPYISIIDNTGRPITTRGTVSIELQGAGLKAGATVLMVPNNDVYVPMYLTKNTISRDKGIHELVYNSIKSYLSDGAKKHLQNVDSDGNFQAKAFMYITSNPKDLQVMNSASGAYIFTDNKGVPSIKVGGNIFTAESETGLKEALGGIYINVTKDLVTGTHALKYNNLLKESTTLSTNIQANPVLLERFENGEYSFLKDNQQYQYFSQHTVVLADSARPTERTQEIAKVIEEELFVFEDLSVDDVTADNEGIRGRLLVSPKISASLQHQMIDSLAYLILSNEKEEGVTNKDKTRRELETNLSKLRQFESSAIGVNKENANVRIGHYELFLEHFDELAKRAQAVLDSLGFKLKEEDDYYENLEEQGEDEGFTRFADDANSTRNQKDFLPSDVKKLLYFLPELAPLDMTNPRDLQIAKDTKKNYKPAINALGMRSFNNFNDTWEKTLGITSATKFGSTKEGFNAMLDKLKDPANAPIVQELAEKLERSPLQLQNAFFRNTYMQNQRNVTLMYNPKSIIQWVGKVKEEFIKRTAYLIRSDRRSAESKIVSDMYNEFKSNRTGLMSIVEEEDKETHIINTEIAKDILKQASDIALNDKSYNTYEKRSKGGTEVVAGNYFTDDAKIKLYNLVKRTGINLTWGAFKDVINYGSRSLSKAKGERAIFKDLFIDKILGTLAGNNGETPGGTLFEKNNPFRKDSTAIQAIALQEYKYRTMRRSGAYRLDGKSYYAYTRHNMLSEMFLQLSKGSDFVVNKLKFDDFAKRSRILNLITSDEGFEKSLQLYYELGAKNRSADNPAKLLKNMTPREHTIMRIAAFQNEGKATGAFMYDTLSDKVTKPIIQMERLNIQGYSVSTQGSVYLSNNTMDTLLNYFEAEYDRIKQVEKENIEFKDPIYTHKLLKNYHDVGNKTGMGKYFHIYYFLNKAFLDVDNPTLSTLIYNADGSLKDRSPEATKGIRSEINKHFNKLFLKSKADFKAQGLFNIGMEKGKPVGDITSLIDHSYLTKDHGILYNLGVSVDRENAKKLDEGRYAEVLGTDLLNRVVDYATIDYVVNSAMFSNEMMMLTGDPAQAGKPIDDASMKSIRETYKDKPNEANKWILLGHIMSTFTNLGKRNAAFLASGEKGMFDNANYNVAIANDIAIDSNHFEDYVRMFPDNLAGIIKAYKKGDLTDAQEVTTVEEHLHVMKAFGKISEETYRKALYHFDPRAYRQFFPGGAETISGEDKINLFNLVMQPQKPVQRDSIPDGDMRMSKQYYIKTSSYPLIPDLVKGTPLEHLLNDMNAKGVHRIAFGSGVKQGIAGSKNLFSKDADGHDVYNESFLTNNSNTLNRDGFRIQLEVPYKASKDHIREGTQQSKLMFVDIPHDLEVIFRGTPTKVGLVQSLYIEYHKRIIDIQTKQLMKEIGDKNDNLDLKKLSVILQKEGEGRGYAMNSLLGLDLNKDNQFKIPLTFLPNAGQMEPVITSIISNRVARLKMPGKSYVQGSEFMLRRGKISEGKDLDTRGIIWTKPEYHNLSKLSYLHEDANGEVHQSQIIMPFYLTKNGEKLRAQDYTKTLEDGRIVLDTDKVDPELLQMNGFRIPFQGHNSGMWFDIVGFLPEEAGDLVLVPGEIAGQMGSDYDVDKLYSYMYNYVHKEEYDRLGADASEWESLKRGTYLKLADMGEQEGEDGKYTKDQFNKALGAVVSERYPDGNVPKHTIVKKGSGKYEISKIHEDDPHSTEALQNAIIDAQKSIYTSTDKGIMKAILDPLSFQDVQDSIDLLGSEGTSTFMGAFDPIYQRDTYFSNITGKLATAICANANTSHSMAQGSNLFVKGQGVVIYNEQGGTYSDRTGQGDDNRVNSYQHGTYEYVLKTKESEELVDQNNGTNNSAWRLDKIYTFPDPVTGKVFRISNLISQLLGVSVDNAKEQLLGAFGINKENLNVVLTIVRAGFSFNVAKAFVNQPILKEYYSAIGDSEDIFDVDYTSNKANKVLTDLYVKYGKMAGMDDNAINNLVTRKEIEGAKFSDLRKSLDLPINEANAKQQLEVFKAYQRYKQISESLATLTGTFGIDVKGLPKNMSETAAKADQIAKILNDNEVLGGITRYADGTIPGLFQGVPSMAVKLFMNPDNPLFVYNSMAYMLAKDDIMELTGKKQLSAEQIDTVHAHIKQYIYSGFKFDTETIEEGRARLLFDTETNESLQTKLGKLQQLYPKNEFLASILMETSTNPKDPKLVSIESSNEDDYVQKIQEYWENMLADTAHPDLKYIAEDMLKYAMWVQPQEFGVSNIVKYMPIAHMLKIGFSEYLNSMHLATNEGHDNDLMKNADLGNFVRQFIQHNPDFLISAKEKTHFLGRPDWTTRQEAAQGEVRTRYVVLNSFTIPAIPTDPKEYAQNRAAGLIRNGSYPKFLKFYSKESGNQIYEGFRNANQTYTYYRISQLGGTNISEYNIASEANTIMDSNLPPVARPLVGPVSAAMNNAGEGGLTKPEDYINLKNANQILDGLIESANSIIDNPGSSQINKTYATYYIELAKQLQYNGLDKVTVVLNNDLGVAGRTNAEGTVVQFSPKVMSKGRTGLSPELEKARTVLHEFLHARVFQGLREDKDSKEYKAIQDVHEAFRKAIQSANNETIRGVSVSALDAELFSVLKTAFDSARDKADLGGISFSQYIDKVVSDEVQLRAVLAEVSKKMDALAAEGKLTDKNYDLVSNPERYGAFKDHIQKNFQKGLGDMINKYYAYHSIDEFITESMTNHKVQNLMRGIPSLWKSFVNSLKDFIAKILGIEDPERTLFDDAIDSIFTFLKTSTTKNNELFEGLDQPGDTTSSEQLTDSFRYFGAGYTMVVDANGQAIDIVGYKSNYTAKKKILDAYNTNPDVDPQTGKKFRNFKGSELTEDRQESLGANKSLSKKEAMLNDGQKQAVEKAMVVLNEDTHENIFDDMFLLSGKGGTGKTFTTEVLIDKIKAKDKAARVAHVAPTWNAVNEILKASDDKTKTASTFASFVGTELSAPNENGVQQFILNKDEKIRKFPPAVLTADYIILDEASMIGGDGQSPKMNSRKEMVSTDAWETLLYRLKQREEWGMGSPKKIILVGDYAQIPPVGTLADHDAKIIERTMQKPETFHVLTENMRTGNEDLNELHEVYRSNIDAARAAFKKGIPSNTSIARNPVPFNTRKNTKNITWVRDTNDALDRYIKTYLQDPENVTNVVFINYNNYHRPETQSMISKIRQTLFGDKVGKTYNPGELTILNGNMASKIKLGGENKEITWHNETRFYVKDVVADTKHVIRQGAYSIQFHGQDLTLVTDYGKERVEFVQFIPHQTEIARVFGQYQPTIKGFKLADGSVIPYGVYKKFEEELPKLNYGYVVNSHKVQGSSYNHTFVDEENLLKSPDTNKAFNNMMYTAISRPKQTLTVLNSANPSEQPITKRTWGAVPVAATTVEHPYPGVDNIPDTGLTVEKANQFIDLLQPQILNQAYVENKARTANRMFSFGLRWAKNVPNDTERSKQRAVGLVQRSGKVPINSPSKYDGYGYYNTDQNFNKLAPISDIAPIKDFIQSKLGIDLKDYDSVLANIYESGSFIHQHRDITESTSAKKYPVVVINLGADGNLIYHTDFSDESKYDLNGNTYGTFENDTTKHAQLPIKNGGIYAFGVNGVNRFTFNHRVSESTQNTQTKPIKVPEWDASGNKIGEKTLTNYRITLTFRRAQDIAPGSAPTINRGISGINIATTSSDPLGRALTNPTWGSKKDGKNYFDVETYYKANKTKEGSDEEKLKGDKNVMYRGIVHKLLTHPELVREIDQRGGAAFIKASSHIIGVKNSRWEGQGEASNFIKVLLAAYNYIKAQHKAADDLSETTKDDIINDLIKRGILKTKC